MKKIEIFHQIQTVNKHPQPTVCPKCPLTRFLEGGQCYLVGVRRAPRAQRACRQGVLRAHREEGHQEPLEGGTKSQDNPLT